MGSVTSTSSDGRRRTATAAAGTSASRPEIEVASPIRLLAVGDRTSSTTGFRECLERLPSTEVEIVVATSLEAALDAIERRAFDAALLHLDLPDGSGVETFRRLHQARPTMPVMVVAGPAEEEAALAAVREGAQEILSSSQDDISV